MAQTSGGQKASMVSVFRIRKHGGRPALALALVTMLLGTSCGGVQPAPATTLAPEDATRMFAAGYSNIDEMYIDKIDLSRWFGSKDVERAKAQMKGWVESLARTGR